MSYATLAAVSILLLFCYPGVHSRSPYGKPVVKPQTRKLKTVLSIDGSGLRTALAAAVLVEVEHSIKRYLLAHREYLPQDAVISAEDDFDVELADYFDVMSGISAGGWITILLASRGGQGFARRVLNDPAMIEKYGVISPGSARAVRVFFLEYAEMIYPPSALVSAAGVAPMDVSNPLSPGITQPVYSDHAGIMTVMETFVGNLTMGDLDTSVVIPAFDTISGYPVLFVTDNVDDVRTTSSAKMSPRFAPRPHGQTPFKPDLQFDEGANYYLKDIAAAASSIVVFYPSKAVARVGSEETEFLCLDGIYPIDSASLLGNFFTASEHGFEGFEEIAVMSIGSGMALRDWTALSNAGLAGWMNDFSLISLFEQAGHFTGDSLMDYFYYSNQNTRPYQYLRINAAAPLSSEEGAAFAQFALPSLVEFYDATGFELGRKYGASIDIFIRDFMFDE